MTSALPESRIFGSRFITCKALNMGAFFPYGSNSDRAEWLEHLMREELDDRLEVGLEEPDLWSNLINTAFGRINWLEVIENNL